MRHPTRALENDKRDWGAFLAKRKLRKRGLAAMFNMPHAVLYPPDWADLLNIYELVRRRKPKVVIEFGSGCSTLMFARALADNGSGHLYSIETSEHFKKYTESYIPADLKPCITMSLSGIAFGEFGGKKVMWHDTVPVVAPNLVYLDGPDYQDFSSEVEIQADGVLLEEKAPSDYAILIDGRLKPFAFTKANLKRHYAVKVNRLHFWELLEPA